MNFPRPQNVLEISSLANFFDDFISIQIGFIVLKRVNMKAISDVNHFAYFFL